MAESKFTMADGGFQNVNQPQLQLPCSHIIALNITVVNAIITPATKSWFYIIYITDMWFSKPLSNWGHNSKNNWGWVKLNSNYTINHHMSVVFLNIHRIPTASHFQAAPGPPTRGAGSEAAPCAGGCHWPKNLGWRRWEGKIMAVECDVPIVFPYFPLAVSQFLAIQISMILVKNPVDFQLFLVSGTSWGYYPLNVSICINQTWLENPQWKFQHTCDFGQKQTYYSPSQHGPYHA